jgi:peptide/nickel transport system ATP-binding protein
MSLVEVENVSFGYSRQRTVLQDVSFNIKAGASVGLVGESGSGKTTLLRLLLGLAQPARGSISFDGAPVDPADRRFMRAYRRNVQAVFQDPYSSLDPRQRIESIVAEPLRSLRIPGNRRAMVQAALAAVGLEPNILRRYPHEFSGGQRQRIAIARAIVPKPKLLLADEAVSALDLSTKVRIVELLKDLASGMTLVFVSHDLGVVAALCDEIVILEHGRIVEAGPTRKILDHPQHDYTKALLASVPRMPGRADSQG